VGSELRRRSVRSSFDRDEALVIGRSRGSRRGTSPFRRAITRRGRAVMSHSIDTPSDDATPSRLERPRGSLTDWTFAFISRSRATLRARTFECGPHRGCSSADRESTMPSRRRSHRRRTESRSDTRAWKRRGVGVTWSLPQQRTTASSARTSSTGEAWAAVETSLRALGESRTCRAARIRTGATGQRRLDRTVNVQTAQQGCRRKEAWPKRSVR
jgi:hypothetical protein